MKKHLYLLNSGQTSGDEVVKVIGIALLVKLLSGFCIGTSGGAMMIAFGVAFYLYRVQFLGGTQMGHQLAVGSKTEIRRAMGGYSGLFILIWLVFKLINFGIGYLGWQAATMAAGGNINYWEVMKTVYGSSFAEVWPYIFAYLLMIVWVLSLFPLIVINNPVW